MKSSFFFSFIWIVSILPLGAEQISLQATVFDYSNQPISDALCVVKDDVNQCYSAMTDSDGRFMIRIYTNTSVKDHHALYDGFEGDSYILASNTGKMYIINILGQTVSAIDLVPGRHPIRLKLNLSSGRYFLLMRTPVFQGMAAAMVVGNNIMGIKPIKTGQRIHIDSRNTFEKAFGNRWILSVYKAGYDSSIIVFDPNTTLRSYGEMIFINRIPQEGAMLPDIVRIGDSVSGWIDNDNSGSWQVDSDFIAIHADTIGFIGEPVDTCFNFTLVYLDSLNVNLTVPMHMQFVHTVPVLYPPLALVAVIETLYSIDPETEYYYQFFKEPIDSVLADMFHVNLDTLASLDLVTIVDDYGEPYINQQMIEIARPCYDTVCTLNDAAAAWPNVIDSLNMLADAGYVVDLIFGLHGSTNGVAFGDDMYDIHEMIGTIQSHDIRIRALYQTCCYGSSTIEEWETYGISAVNGSVSVNGLCIMAVVNFIKSWVGGVTFTEAVQYAYDAEIALYSSYTDCFPFISLWITEDVLNNSRQFVGGSRPDLMWTDLSMFSSEMN